jgi:hypothetical protein
VKQCKTWNQEKEEGKKTEKKLWGGEDCRKWTIADGWNWKMEDINVEEGPEGMPLLFEVLSKRWRIRSLNVFNHERRRR